MLHLATLEGQYSQNNPVDFEGILDFMTGVGKGVNLEVEEWSRVTESLKRLWFDMTGESCIVPLQIDLKDNNRRATAKVSGHGLLTDGCLFRLCDTDCFP